MINEKRNFASWFMNNKCNFNCRYCSTRKKLNKQKNEFGLYEIKKGLDKSIS